MLGSGGLHRMLGSDFSRPSLGSRKAIPMSAAGFPPAGAQAPASLALSGLAARLRSCVGPSHRNNHSIVDYGSQIVKIVKLYRRCDIFVDVIDLRCYIYFRGDKQMALITVAEIKTEAYARGMQTGEESDHALMLEGHTWIGSLTSHPTAHANLMTAWREVRSNARYQQAAEAAR
jgi:hypothetical protein